MDIGNLFWLVFIAIALQPILASRWLKATRASRMGQIQKKRKSRVIAIIHRQEAMRFLGFPIARYIDMDDAEKVLYAIRTTPPERPIDLILHTPGGLVLAAVQIARALKAHNGHVTVFIPHFAMSGGTLLALAADQIVMCEHAMLGPIDPQVGGMPAASIIKATAQKPLSEIDDKTFILADLSEKAVAQLQRQACELMRAPMPAEEARALAEKLTSGRWTHDYPISVAEARELGLNISTDMPEEIVELLSLFPQPIRSAQGVEYGPGAG